MNSGSHLKSGVVFLQQITDDKVRFSRGLRKNMTGAETVLWNRLRNRQCAGLKFRRQQIVEGFIVDFFCESAKLVIEVDGSAHDTAEQRKTDELRRRVFKARGLKEIRVKNNEILVRIDSVLEAIKTSTKR